MRKILLATFLLILLFAISYIKSVRGDSSREAYLLEGQKESSRLLQSKDNQIDSLALVAGNLEVALADSLTKQKQGHQREVDSLKRTLDATYKQIVKLEETQELAQSQKLEQSQKANITKKKTVASKPKNPILDENEKILRYYKKRYNALPDDLSSYERKIALNEIKEETANKFNITLSELKSIRSKNKLSY